MREILPIEGFNSYEFAWLLAEDIRALRFTEDGTEPISETEALDIGVWFTNEYGIRWGLAQIAHMIGRSRERVRQIEEQALERLAKSEPAQLLKLLRPSDRAAHWSDMLEGGDDLDGVNRHVHHQYMKLFGSMEIVKSRKRRWQEKNRKAGLCVTCGKEPIVKNSRCERHHTPKYDSRQRYNEKRKHERKLRRERAAQALGSAEVLASGDLLGSGNERISGIGGAPGMAPNGDSQDLGNVANERETLQDVHQGVLQDEKIR